MERKIIASEGKIIARLIDNEPLGKVIYLGIEDLEENYIEIDDPEYIIEEI